MVIPKTTASKDVGRSVPRRYRLQARWTSSAARPGSQNAQRNYERYLALARAEAQVGNSVGAENYYQYAEHYFKSMSSDRERR
jgi:Domain of unknown function (DUF4167)